MADQASEPAPGALRGLRVLDLTDYRAQLCARLLADMGADVIKVEPPGGDGARRIGPFVDDRPDPDRSLFFWFYNLNKRSLTLELKHPRGAELFRRLARSADVIVESFPPGGLGSMKLGWNTLHQENPALILCSITPFGQSGPRRDFVAEDTVITALSGMLYVNGYPNRPPVRPLGLQAYHSAAYYGAIATMCALLARQTKPVGRWIDLSMQEAAASTVEHVAPNYFTERKVERRHGTLHWNRFFRVGKCRDGYVLHCTLGDWTSLVEWVASDGKAADLTAPEYQEASYRAARAEHIFDVLDRWAKQYRSEELVERAQTLRLPYARLRRPEELFDDKQLVARGYFVEVEHPELNRSFRYPGPPYLFSGTPWQVYRRPPLLGEHSDEILDQELGLTTDQMSTLHTSGVV